MTASAGSRRDGLAQRIGILGAGQLGQMLALAGIPLGARFSFYSPTPSPSASAVGKVTVAEYEDSESLRAFARSVDVVTYEFENVSADAVSIIEAECKVWPPREALFTSQDRALEKERFQRLGIPVAPYRVVDSLADLKDAIAHVGARGILKTRRFGYDGKGQARISEPGDAQDAFESLGGSALVYEKLVAFERELSVIAVRGIDGVTVCYPVVQNHHRDGILRTTVAPAPELDRGKCAEAERYVRALLEDFGYVGIIALELFDTSEGLLANEMAPRVHNTGHWTIEGAETSQFENHIRAVCGMPLGSCDPVGHSVMINLIGGHPDTNAVLHVEDAHLHLYGKSERAGRKLGHVTVRSATRERAARQAEHLQASTAASGSEG